MCLILVSCGGSGSGGGGSSPATTDQTPPIVTAPANLILTTMDGYAIASRDPYVAAFLNGATAVDNVDLVLTITNNAPANFPPGQTTVTFSSTDLARNRGQTTAIVNVQGRMFVGLTAQRILLSSFTAWEAKAGHKVHRIHHFYDFTTPAFMWTNEIPTALNAGYPVMLTMQPQVGSTDTSSHLRDIYSGVMDPYIDASITGIKNLRAAFSNADIWMRFGHEMNGDWYPWGAGFNQGTAVRHLGNTPQDYINAYRHIVDRFRAAGLASNMVKWVFSPNVWSSDNFSEHYPGDTYVDMISVSGFNFGSQTALHPTLTWQSLDTIHQYTYNRLTTLHPNKPYFIGGISSAELGGNKAAWIDDMALKLNYKYPKMAGIFWFDVNKKAVGEADWRIDSSVPGLAATQRMYTRTGAWKP